MSKGEGYNKNIWVKPEHVATVDAALMLSLDWGISFSELVALALEDFVTLHQHLVVGEHRWRSSANAMTGGPSGGWRTAESSGTALAAQRRGTSTGTAG